MKAVCAVHIWFQLTQAVKYNPHGCFCGSVFLSKAKTNRLFHDSGGNELPNCSILLKGSKMTSRKILMVDLQRGCSLELNYSSYPIIYGSSNKQNNKIIRCSQVSNSSLYVFFPHIPVCLSVLTVLPKQQPHLTGCVSTNMETFCCRWNVGTFQNLSEPGELRLFYIKTE